MKRIARELKERSAAGKNTPIAKDAPGVAQQNGELEPSRAAARKTGGTDEAQNASRK